MAKKVIHVPESEAASGFAALLARVLEGAEVIIEKDDQAVAVVRPALSRPRLLSEAIALAAALGSAATLDPDFAKDLEAAVNSHREPLSPRA